MMLMMLMVMLLEMVRAVVVVELVNHDELTPYSVGEQSQQSSVYGRWMYGWMDG